MLKEGTETFIFRQPIRSYSWKHISHKMTVAAPQQFESNPRQGNVLNMEDTVENGTTSKMGQNCEIWDKL